MATHHGASDVTIYCQIYGCDGATEVPSGTKYEDVVCGTCGCPMWPIELGFTGNSRESVIEFARTHNRDGTYIGGSHSATIKEDILEHLGVLRKEASLEAVRGKLDRLATLNCRSIGQIAGGVLTTEEEVERRFLSLTLPHASRRGEIKDLLKLLD